MIVTRPVWTAAIDALKDARARESAAEVAATAAAEVANNAKAVAEAAYKDLKDADTGPASEDLADQDAEKAIKGAQTAFALLDSIPRPEDDDYPRGR